MDKFLELVADAAQKLGFEAARIWPQVVMIHWLKSLVGTILIPMLLVGSLSLLIKFYKRVQLPMPPYNKGGGEEFARRIVLGIAGGVGTIVMGIIFLVEWSSFLAGTFWPEASLVLNTLSRSK